MTNARIPVSTFIVGPFELHQFDDASIDAVDRQYLVTFQVRHADLIDALSEMEAHAECRGEAAASLGRDPVAEDCAFLSVSASPDRQSPADKVWRHVCAFFGRHHG